MSVEIGQFDDAPARPGHAYIDDLPESSDSDTPLSEYSDLDDAEFDDLRVEDEDWEISERGPHTFFSIHPYR
jgi:hypothetical protein